MGSFVQMHFLRIFGMCHLWNHGALELAALACTPAARTLEMAARTCLWAAGVFEVSAGACFGAAFSLEMGVAVGPNDPGPLKIVSPA